MPKAFLCHSSKDSKFILEVATYLKKNLEWVFLYEEYQRCDRSFVDTITRALDDCDIMIIFVGPAGLSQYQLDEFHSAFHKSHDQHQLGKFIIILLPGVENIPPELGLINTFPCSRVNKPDENEAYRVSKEIIHDHLQLVWEGGDDLPLNPALFDYEKDIINYFINKSLMEQQIADIESQLSKLDPTSDAYRELQAELCNRQVDYQPIRDKLLDGCPVEWPKVRRWTDHMQPNKLDQNLVGKFRTDDAKVVTAALSNSHLNFSLIEKELWFPEAGPREMLEYPQHGRNLNVAVVVSGGIAPGVNAVIDGISQRHHMYAKEQHYHVKVYGYKNGLQAFEALNMSQCILIPGDDTNPHPPIETIETSSHVDEGGSIIGTSRFKELIDSGLRKVKLTNIVTQLFLNQIDILYVIGGDGSMKAAHAIWSYAQEFARVNHENHKVSVVAIPKSMDNDILWVWQTFGFLSAVERAREIIGDLVTEARSNPRLGVVQLFGSDSGFVVSHAVLASRTGICDAALIPEISFSMQELARYLKNRICARFKDLGETSIIPYGFIVLAETAIPTDAMNFLDDPAIGLDNAEKAAVKDFTEKRNHSQRIEGQTNDALRTAGLKIVSRGLVELIPNQTVDYQVQPDWKKLRVFTNEPRHLLRATPPRSNDIITAQRLGILAVDNALAGFTDFMVSQWLTEYVLVPLKLVVLGRKRIPKEGIFWKSVLAKTGQDFDMD